MEFFLAQGVVDLVVIEFDVQGLAAGTIDDGGNTARAAQAAGKGQQARLILSGAERLVAPERMGRLFKALCVCDPALPPPPGFDAA